MPKLTRGDWEKLKFDHKVTFRCMDENLFNLLLDKIFAKSNPGSNLENPGDIDDIDALMVYLAHAEPPIPPW